MKNLHSFEDIAIIIVLYAQKLEESITYWSLKRSVENCSDEKISLIVYDNSPSKSFNEKSFTLDCFNVTYISNPSNPGVSKAYNDSVHKACTENKSWALLLDQDTDMQLNTMQAYLKSINESPAIKLHVPILKVGEKFFSPCHYYFTRGFHWNSVTPGIYDAINKSILNSGIMIEVSCFLNLEGYNEKIQLYFSDFDFFDRYKKCYDTFKVIESICYHTLSDIVSKDKKSSYNRYRHYCIGALETYRKNPKILIAMFMVFLRGLKLSWNYKSIRFISIYVSIFFLKDSV